MRLTIHRDNIAQDQDGDWWHKVDGEWIETEEPFWAKQEREEKSREVSADFQMQEPKGYVRSSTEVAMVKVYKITEKIVPDFEAEVLCRHGWERVIESVEDSYEA